MAVGPQESVLAPRFSRVVAVFIVAICAVTEYSLVAYGHVDVLLRASPAVFLVAFGVYTMSWKPLVRVSSTEIEIINPLRTSRIGWGAVRDIATRWTLTVVTDRGAISAWAAPSQSPWESVGRLRRDALGRPSLAAQQTKSSKLAPAVGLAQLVVRQWETYRDSETGAEVHTRWSMPTIVVLSALIALTAVGALWP